MVVLIIKYKQVKNEGGNADIYESFGIQDDLKLGISTSIHLELGHCADLAAYWPRWIQIDISLRFNRQPINQRTLVVSISKLFGCACVAIGVWALLDESKLLVFTEIGNPGEYDVISLVTTAAYIFIASGAFAVIVGFFGCCGAVKENNCLLITYSALVLLTLVMQVAVVVISILFHGKVTAELKAFLQDRINEEYDGNIKSAHRFSKAMDLAQVQFMCCGVNNYGDFYNATKWQNTKNQSDVIPFTCCKLDNKVDFYKDVDKARMTDPNCLSQPTSDNSYMDKGCWESIEMFVMSKAPFFIGIGVGIAVAEVRAYFVSGNYLQSLRSFNS
ncbi:hypothetical protein FSP39_014140 [Pinctada imbricata]|uniref:Tetraspanin n=1 Tax=Pinctada imbricata TaxID=66713 RepID=A0AA89BR85_PINIB|nr:hypothetical protein FSP39_014140 [Pinctada imbricata]